ncbi:hypothetical protein [Polaribacter sp.]|uniref:hypothetical protein n=1 Tax=Polaribacter sp. TaxID=1920175 RepID=UPI003F6BD548
MKQLSLFILVLIMISCEDHIPTTQHLSVIVDVTDAKHAKPKTNDVLNYLEQGSPSDGLEITLRYVSETRYAPKYQFILRESAVGWLSNEDTQRRRKKKLLQQFKDTLEHTQIKESPRSEIFRLVCSEIKSLNKKEGAKKLVLFSDLREHSFFSVYQKYDVGKLLHQEEQVLQKFIRQAELPEDLSGIALYIVYSPKLKEDEIFTAMIKLYQSIFESRGVELHISNEKKVMY